MTVTDLFAATRTRLITELAATGVAVVVHTTPSGQRHWEMWEPGHPKHPDRNETT